MTTIYVTAILSNGTDRPSYSVVAACESQAEAIRSLAKHLTTRRSAVFLRDGSTGKRLSVEQVENQIMAHIPWSAKQDEWKRLAQQTPAEATAQAA